MSRLEGIIWIMVALYTITKIILGEYYTVILLLPIIALRIIIWRLKEYAQ